MEYWIPSAIIYQVNLRAIAAREPRNPLEAAHEEPSSTHSPLAYLTQHLDVLQELGINVLHIMPPFPMGVVGRKGIGSPYSVRDYHAIDPEHGTLDEFKALVRAAHDRELRVILGMVPNHTSRDNTWVTSHPEFYVRNDEGEISHDLDWSDTAKLDYHSPGLREAMAGVLSSWLTLLGPDASGRTEGVDGFRFDMAHFINDRSFWNDTLDQLHAQHAGRQFLFLAECYGMENNLDLFKRGMNAAYDDEFYKASEYLYGLDVDGQSALLPHIDLYSNPRNRARYDLYSARGIAGVMAESLAQYERTLPAASDAPRLARYTDNHDEGRGLFRYGPGATRAVNELVFFSPHALPFLLAGQEFGALNRPAIHDRIRPCEKGYRHMADGRIKWRDGVEFEGNLFVRGTENRADWHTFYRELIRLRRSTPELVHGDFKLLDLGEDAPGPARSVVAFDRRLDGQPVRCVVNVGPGTRRLAHAAHLRGDILYGSLDDDRIPPFSSLVVRCRA